MVGMILGGLLFGYLADHSGRKMILLGNWLSLFFQIEWFGFFFWWRFDMGWMCSLHISIVKWRLHILCILHVLSRIGDWCCASYCYSLCHGNGTYWYLKFQKKNELIVLVSNWISSSLRFSFVRHCLLFGFDFTMACFINQKLENSTSCRIISVNNHGNSLLVWWNEHFMFNKQTKKIFDMILGHSKSQCFGIQRKKIIYQLSYHWRELLDSMVWYSKKFSPKQAIFSKANIQLVLNVIFNHY